MITLLASLSGFISALIPELVKLMKDRNDKNHELQMLLKKFEHLDSVKSSKIMKMSIKNELDQHNALYATYKSGISMIDALNASVRPVLAYSFFLMYAIVKFTQYKAIAETVIIAQYLEILWSMDDQAIFASIISFYFGQRTFSKLWKYKM